MRSLPLSLLRRTLAATLFLLIAATGGAAQQATITGRVTAEGSGEALGASRVFLVGTSLSAAADATGQYTIRNVPAGLALVRVIHVGYVEQKKPVTVVAGQSVTLDFTMQQSVVRLADIVTTATGDQRKSELGNSIATLGDVSKRVEESPVTEVSQLLVAKAPGVVVLPGSMTGTAGTIRIRGLNSISLGNAPIWVVDGVRFTSGSIGVSTGGVQTTMLSGLNPEEIEDIEIVKGPSAATLYGTDAANGVIVVTTKRGRAGPARWSWYGESGLIKDRAHYPDTYALWGHQPATPGTQTRCFLIDIPAGACAVDSMTTLNVIDVPELSPVSSGFRNQIGAQVSGGTEAVRYFISSDIESETGPVKLPRIDVDRYNAAGTPIRPEWTRPEKLERQSIRANINATISPTLDISVNTGFVKTNQRLTQTDNNFFSIFYQAMMSPGFRGPGPGYSGVGTRGEELNGNNGYTYGDIFQRYVREDIQRILGSISANWRPYSWLQNQGTVGIDLSDRDDYTLCRFQECPDQGTLRLGSVSSAHSNNRNFSAKLTSTASWQPRPWAVVQSTLGSDYTNIASDATNSSGTTLPPGAQTVNAAANRLGGSGLPTATKTLGLYLQEQVGFNDRLFVIVAARSDQNSAFGTNFQNVLYPKASVSWILSDEPYFPRLSWVGQFRLRGAYGVSGVQPGATDALVTYSATTVNVLGTDTPGLRANDPGNPDLRPERSGEFEGGFDARMFDDRVNLEFTYYRKQTKDALINQQIAPSAGSPVSSILKNLGSVRNQGVEVSLTSSLANLPQLGWDVTLAGSYNGNEVLSLGPDITVNGTGSSRDSVGLPINGLFYRKYTYDDANGDGIIEPDEIAVDDDFSFIGNSTPTTILSLTNGFDLLKGKLRLNFLFDYKGGFYILNSTYNFQCSNQPFPCAGRSNLNASLDEQAAAVAATLTTPSTSWGFVNKADFWRFRELSATIDAPQRVTTLLRARAVSLMLGARNLKLWTKYTGADPEENYGTGDQQQTFASSAPRSYFTMRLNLSY